MQPSAKNLINLIQGEWLGLSAAEEIAMIDVHTGLGPTGVDTLISNPPTAIEESFPTETDYGSTLQSSESNKEETRKKPVVTGGIRGSFKENGNENDALSGCDLTVGQTTTALCDNWLSQSLPHDKVTCILQEFGTVSSITVGKKYDC